MTTQLAVADMVVDGAVATLVALQTTDAADDNDDSEGAGDAAHASAPTTAAEIGARAVASDVMCVRNVAVFDACARACSVWLCVCCKGCTLMRASRAAASSTRVPWYAKSVNLVCRV
jgi:hypothetical protein